MRRMAACATESSALLLMILAAGCRAVVTLSWHLRPHADARAEHGLRLAAVRLLSQPPLPSRVLRSDLPSLNTQWVSLGKLGPEQRHADQRGERGGPESAVGRLHSAAGAVDGVAKRADPVRRRLLVHQRHSQLLEHDPAGGLHQRALRAVWRASTVTSASFSSSAPCAGVVRLPVRRR